LESRRPDACAARSSRSSRARRQQRGRIGMVRTGEDALAGPISSAGPGRARRSGPTDSARWRGRGNEQVAHAVLGLQFGQQIQNRRLDRDVERGGRFVAPRIRGLPAKARAIAARVLESARQLARTGDSSGGRPAAPSGSAARAAPGAPPSEHARASRELVRSADAGWCETVQGESGFWNTICNALRWSARRALLSPASVISVQCNHSAGIRERRDPSRTRARVVLPLPDSPTRAERLARATVAARPHAGRRHRMTAAAEGLAQPTASSIGGRLRSVALSAGSSSGVMRAERLGSAVKVAAAGAGSPCPRPNRKAAERREGIFPRQPAARSDSQPRASSSGAGGLPGMLSSRP